VSAVVGAVRRVPPAPGAALGAAAPRVRVPIAREALRAALALGAATVWGALVLVLGG
jgi:hypothetical protein